MCDSDAPVTYNAHHYGVAPEAYLKNHYLADFFQVLSTNKDRDGKMFVSSGTNNWMHCLFLFLYFYRTVESKHGNVYAYQWHAEKPQFEWNPNLAINHASESIVANGWMARYLVDQVSFSIV